jgi:hypothetical protein
MPPPNVRNFIACPVVRDTKSVPCWLAEYQGETYFLVLQTDVSAPVTPPWLNHKVLVEGTVSNEPNICGGKVIKPVTLSVLPEIDASCNTVLPAEDRYNLTFEPPRPPGPSMGKLAFGYDNLEKAKPADPPGQKQFVIDYDFNGLVVFRHPRYLMPVLDYARDKQAKHLEIMGYRGSTLLSNGELIVEEPGIARLRAEQVVELLKGAGLTDVEYQVRWKDVAEKTNGSNGPDTRRVTVLVK